jgi:hypothetical protein
MRMQAPALVGSEKSENIYQEKENLIERTSEKMKVGRFCKKSFAEGTKHAVISHH